MPIVWTDDDVGFREVEAGRHSISRSIVPPLSGRCSSDFFGTPSTCISLPSPFLIAASTHCPSSCKAFINNFEIRPVKAGRSLALNLGWPNDLRTVTSRS